MRRDNSAAVKRSSELRRLPDDIAAERTIASRYMHRARKDGIPFTITLDEAVWLFKQPCRYCGSPPQERSTHRGVVRLNGIDRVDSSLGYELTNVVACCKVCNRAKNDMTEREFVRWFSGLLVHMLKRTSGLNEVKQEALRRVLQLSMVID